MLRLCGCCLLLLTLGGTLLLILIESGKVMIISHALKLVLACGRNTIRVAIPRHLHSTVAIIGYYLGRPLLTVVVGKVVCVTCIKGKSAVDAVCLLLRILLSQCLLRCLLLCGRVYCLISREYVTWTHELEFASFGITHEDALATIADINHAAVILHVDGAINDIHLAVVQLQCCRVYHAVIAIHAAVYGSVAFLDAAVYIIPYTVNHTVIGRFGVHIVQCKLFLVL